MRMRGILLAGIASTLLAAPPSPAFAVEAWYLALGAGWDHLQDPTVTGAGIDGKLNAKDSAIISASVGYKFSAPFRIEFEDAWDRHSTGDFTSGATTLASSGHAEVRSAMVNALYDDL